MGLSPIVSCLSIEKVKPDINYNLDNNNHRDHPVFAYANFDWSPDYPDPGEEVTFFSTSQVTNGRIYDYTWIFPDGSKYKSSRVKYTFEEKGSYNVKLKVIAYTYDHSDISFDSTSKNIKIGASPFPIFNVEPYNPSPFENVTLNATASYDVNGRIIYYNWSMYKTENPENIEYLDSKMINYYTWDEQGRYNISLFVKDDDGFSNKITKTITVSIIKIEKITSNKEIINFIISNHGMFKAQNITWTFDILRYNLFDRTKNIYHKSGTIEELEINTSKNSTIEDFNRFFCKVKIIITAGADNAEKIEKSVYGLVYRNNLYIYEEDFWNPYVKIADRVITTLGFLFFIFVLISILSCFTAPFRNNNLNY